MRVLGDMISKFVFTVGRRCGVVSVRRVPRSSTRSPIITNLYQQSSFFSDKCEPSCGTNVGSSGGGGNSSSKAKLKIKRQEGTAGVMPSFGDDECDDEDKKCALSKKGCQNNKDDKKIKKKRGDKDDDGDSGDEDDDFDHKLSDDESHIMREEMNKAAQEKAMFVTKAGAVANVSLALSKGAVGFAISSTGLIADAANSLGDVLCDGVVYYTVQEARKTATPDRPWGRGKVESIGKIKEFQK